MTETEYWVILIGLMTFSVGLGVFALIWEQRNRREARRAEEAAGSTGLTAAE